MFYNPILQEQLLFYIFGKSKRYQLISSSFMANRLFSGHIIVLQQFYELESKSAKFLNLSNIFRKIRIFLNLQINFEVIILLHAIFRAFNICELIDY